MCILEELYFELNTRKAPGRAGVKKYLGNIKLKKERCYSGGGCLKINMTQIKTIPILIFL